MSPTPVLAAPWCGPATVTAYVRNEGSSRTYDGTSIYADLPIVAASWDIRMGSTVWIEGLGEFEVHDRGHLGDDAWVDVAMWTRTEALEWGRQTRQICVY